MAAFHLLRNGAPPQPAAVFLESFSMILLDTQVVYLCLASTGMMEIREQWSSGSPCSLRANSLEQISSGSCAHSPGADIR